MKAAKYRVGDKVEVTTQGEPHLIGMVERVNENGPSSNGENYYRIYFPGIKRSAVAFIAESELLTAPRGASIGRMRS